MTPPSETSQRSKGRGVENVARSSHNATASRSRCCFATRLRSSDLKGRGRDAPFRAASALHSGAQLRPRLWRLASPCARAGWDAVAAAASGGFAARNRRKNTPPSAAVARLVTFRTVTVEPPSRPPESSGGADSEGGIFLHYRSEKENPPCNSIGSYFSLKNNIVD